MLYMYSVLINYFSVFVNEHVLVRNPCSVPVQVFVPAPSLDVVMMENYAAELQNDASHGFRGWPLTWEPVVNCPGPSRSAVARFASTAGEPP